MKITGELLKTERLSKQMSVQEVAQSLKLSSRVINALENGNLNDLPAKTFVRGFVKAYAQLLRLDTESVLRQFQEEMGSTMPLPKVPPPAPPSSSEPDRESKAVSRTHNQSSIKSSASKTNILTSGQEIHTDHSKKIIYSVLAAVVLVFILLLSNKLFTTLKNDPVVTSTEEPRDTTTESNTVSAAELATATSNEAGPNEDNANASVPPLPSESEIAAPSLDIDPATKKSGVLEDGFEKSNNKPVELIIESKKDVSLFYSKADLIQFNELKLKANQLQVLRSKTGLYLKTSDGGAIKLTVNGQELGSAGANNKPVKLSF